MKNKNTNLRPAIDHFGSLAATSIAIGCHPNAAHKWQMRGLPPERAVQIAKASGGAVKPSDLLPGFEWW